MEKNKKMHPLIIANPVGCSYLFTATDWSTANLNVRIAMIRCLKSFKSLQLHLNLIVIRQMMKIFLNQSLAVYYKC